MILTARRRNGNYTTSYLATVGSREAREAGFIREEGKSRILKKEVDPEKGTLTFSVDWDAENNRMDV